MHLTSGVTGLSDTWLLRWMVGEWTVGLDPQWGQVARTDPTHPAPPPLSTGFNPELRWGQACEAVNEEGSLRQAHAPFF